MCIKLSKFYNLKLISIICLVFFILDRILKYLALAGKINFHKNFGIAFSIGVPKNLFLYFYIFIFLILLVIVWQLIKEFVTPSFSSDKSGLPVRRSLVTRLRFLLIIGYSLLITGCISNLIDRLKFGFIIDYLNFGFFYNNLADVMVCLGVLILIYSLIFKKK